VLAILFAEPLVKVITLHMLILTFSSAVVNSFTEQKLSRASKCCIIAKYWYCVRSEGNSEDHETGQEIF